MVERDHTSAQVIYGAGVIGVPNDHNTTIGAGPAIRHAVGRRAKHANRVTQMTDKRQPACLTKQQARVTPRIPKITWTGKPRRGIETNGGQRRAKPVPQRIGFILHLWPVIHRQYGNGRCAHHVAWL